MVSLIDITRWQFNRDPFVDKGPRLVRKQCPLFLFTRRPVHVRATQNILYTHARHARQTGVICIRGSLARA